MLQVEVPVAPVFVFRVHVRAERRTSGLRRAMPVQHVLIERVIGREVEAAAEPPRRGLAVLRRDEEAHVCVRRRHVGIARVDHERHAGRFEARAGQFGPLRRGRSGQLAAEHVREIDAGLLEHGAVAHHARFAATAFGALPRVTPKLHRCRPQLRAQP